MAQIKANEVAKLRKMTGAGMMDCKKALQETEGDFDAAVDVLRKKGQKVASKRADREATEGAVLAKTTADKKFGALITLNCETDFVAKNEDFVAFANKILNLALNERPTTLDELKALKLDTGVTVEAEITTQIGVIGEKLELAVYETLAADTVVAYIHPGNKLAALTGFNKEVDERVAKDVVMQVAAMNPAGVDKNDVPKEVIDKELEIGKELAIQEGKPAELAEKIAFGRLNKFFKESTLLNQQFVKDNKMTIADYLKQSDKDLKVTGFRRYTLNV